MVSVVFSFSWTLARDSRILLGLFVLFVLPEPVGDPTWPASLVLCLGYMEDTKAQGTQKVVSSTLEDSCQSTFYFSNFQNPFIIAY